MKSAFYISSDWIVFFAFLIGSTAYPLWIEYKKKCQKAETKETYVFAKGRISIFAMMLSIARGNIGVRSVLGYPSELFYRGTSMYETLYGIVTAYPIVCFVFVPVYLNLGITSVYQYLDLRFKSQFVRKLASATFVIRNIFLLGVTVYTPSIALKVNVGIPYIVSIGLITSISILFTIFGNLKATITADAIQGITMIIVTITVIVQGIIEAGGFTNVYQRNLENNRFKFFYLSNGSTTRIDTLSAWLGQLFISLSTLGCQQNNVQRYMSMNSLKEVTKTLMANIPFIIFLFSLPWIAGMVIYSTYFDCDPLITGDINRMDAILPYFIEDKLAYIPGFLGLFMASIFNSALCITLSGLNSLATVTWEDFLLPLPIFNGISDRKQLILIKTIGVSYSLLIMGIAYIVGLLSGVIESALLMSSAIVGPLVGVFVLAMLVPFANWKGASLGIIVAHIISTLLVAGKFATVGTEVIDMLPTSAEGCFNNSNIQLDTPSFLMFQENHTHLYETVSVKPPNENSFFLEAISHMSFMYYSVIGAMVTIVVGIFVSLITQSKQDEYDSKLLHAVVLKISNSIPGKKLYSNPLKVSSTTT